MTIIIGKDDQLTPIFSFFQVVVLFSDTLCAFFFSWQDYVALLMMNDTM